MHKVIFTTFLLFFTNLAVAADHFLLSSEWLMQNLHNKDLRIIDMSDDMQYRRFHIPGAVHLPYEALNRHTQQGVSFSAGSEHIRRVMGLLGVTADMQVVIYDDTGGLNASRLFWELEQLGHPRVALLDGGLVKWILSGYKVEASYPQISTKQYQAPTSDNHANLAVLNDLGRNNSIILDVRTKDEYLGNLKQPRSGHIPKAKWWEWQQAVNFENGFQLKPAGVIQGELSSLGLADKKAPVILYCHSGHRAAHSYFVLRNLGYQNVKVYDGSMAEYQLHKNLPLTKGPNP